MGRVDASPRPHAIELVLPWGPASRGVRWGAGPDTALFLHEPGTDLDAWGALPSRLAYALGMAAVAIDLPGHGLSDDPWEPEKAGQLVSVFIERVTAPTPAAAEADNDSLVAQTPLERRYVVSAGIVASAIHAQGADPALAGIVSLSPSSFSPSPGSTGERGREVRAVPKLLFAGSHADDDLETARRLASAGAGWATVTSIPVSERGTGLLATPWRARIEEAIIAFLRDCQHRRPGVQSGSRPAPPPLG